MHFATSIPWWLALPAIAGLIALAYAAYRRPLVPLSRAQRSTLMGLRAATLLLLLALICRPVLQLPPLASGDVVVPVLIDVSRSMRIADAGGRSRLSRAIEIAREAIRQLSGAARIELLAFSDRIEPAALDGLAPDARHTDIGAALDAAQARYRGRRVAGMLLLSDGGDASLSVPTAGREGAMRVFAVGIGSSDGVPDREITSLTATDPRLDQASAELHVTAVSRGFGRDPFQLKILANGQAIETRQVTPSADNAPVEARFTVFPDAARASIYTVAVDEAAGEQVTENNSRSVALGSVGRRRRVLLLAGAPGFDHSFFVRALAQDAGLEVDTIIRKGKNDANEDTFLVQAGGGRAATLASGFPATREALFGYDALVIANLESDFFSKQRLGQAAAFVAERGGGLLVMGGRSFERRGLTATPLEEVLPVELTDRRGGPIPASADDESAGHDTAALTAEGVLHPIMQIGEADRLGRLWATLPALASTAPLGGPRPGASVLATTTAVNGQRLPLVAVQRYGRGRSMVFAGEAAWRWRMLAPAGDRRYDFFWRQSVRWLANDSPEPVSMTIPHGLEAGDSLVVPVEIRDRAFAPVDGADVEVRLTNPTGATTRLTSRPAGKGQVSAAGTLDGPGLYRVEVEARKSGVSLGHDDRWVAVADGEREFADPRLSEGTLRRLARDSGGRYAAADAAKSVLDELAKVPPGLLQPQQRDVWHEPWVFALVVLLLSVEWVLRRLWGLR